MNLIKLLLEANLKAYSTVLFSSQSLVGFLILLTTFLNPQAGITGLLGAILSNLIAYLLGVHEDRIKKGLYGFNGLLFGLSISLYYEINISLLLMLLAACVVLIFVTLALEHSLGFFFGLPVLSIPFVIISIMVYLAFYNYQGFTLKSNYEPLKIDSYFPVLPSHINFYFKSFGAIFFQSSPWAGLIFSLILFYFSRIAFFLSILGYASGVAFHIFLKGNMIDISAGTVGFNHMLTAIAVGGIFLVPSPYTFILAIFASISSALIASFVKIFFINFSIPVLALPFVTVSLLFLHVARLLRNDRFRVVDFLPGSPENNLDYYKTRLERFGSTILDIRLPFSGKWKVSQGYSGKFTHKNLWKESLDFMAVDAEGNIRKGKDTTLNDYYTFGLPVLAPAVGRVVKVVNHLEDNPPGEMDNKENWGNLVLIEHSSYLYSQLSHLQKDSVLVKEGDIVQAGMKLGLAGSSGRSPEPHIHLHFQSTPEVGSTTVPLGFTQYTFYEDKEKRIQYNHVPKEEDIISNIVSDFNMKSFFSLAPGLSIPIRIVKNSGKLTKENWVSGVDFWGNRFIEDEKSNRLIFFLGKDSFSCLDYLGNPNTPLFLLYLAMYRVPFINSNAYWEDRLPYKHFSKLYIRIWKDFIQPFSDKLYLQWKAKMDVNSKENPILYSNVSHRGEKKILELSLEFTGNLPGLILVRNSENQWMIERDHESD